MGSSHFCWARVLMGFMEASLGGHVITKIGAGTACLVTLAMSTAILQPRKASMVTMSHRSDAKLPLTQSCFMRLGPMDPMLHKLGFCPWAHSKQNPAPRRAYESVPVLFDVVQLLIQVLEHRIAPLSCVDVPKNLRTNVTLSPKGLSAPHKKSDLKQPTLVNHPIFPNQSEGTTGVFRRLSGHFLFDVCILQCL